MCGGLSCRSLSGLPAEAHNARPDNALMPRPQNLDRSISTNSGIPASDRFQVCMAHTVYDVFCLQALLAVMHSQHCTSGIPPPVELQQAMHSYTNFFHSCCKQACLLHGLCTSATELYWTCIIQLHLSPSCCTILYVRLQVSKIRRHPEI